MTTRVAMMLLYVKINLVAYHRAWLSMLMVHLKNIVSAAPSLYPGRRPKNVIVLHGSDDVLVA